jgi:hypothetical protein
VRCNGHFFLVTFNPVTRQFYFLAMAATLLGWQV